MPCQGPSLTVITITNLLQAALAQRRAIRARRFPSLDCASPRGLMGRAAANPLRPTHPTVSVRHRAHPGREKTLSNRSNYDRRAQPMGKEELRQRMWDELVYEYEAEAHKWMTHEAEMRRRAQERERDEARRRIVQEDVMRIQARVRERRDSERQAIAEERRRSMESAKEKARRDQVRAERATMEAWNAYESRWSAISASSEPLGFRDIPWPVLVAPIGASDLTPEDISGFLLHPAHSSNHSRRERIRAALLRWHPDRFRRILNRVVDSEKSVIEEGVGVIARCLNELLAKEGKALLQGS